MLQSAAIELASQQLQLDGHATDILRKHPVLAEDVARFADENSRVATAQRLGFSAAIHTTHVARIGANPYSFEYTDVEALQRHGIPVAIAPHAQLPSLADVYSTSKSAQSIAQILEIMAGQVDLGDIRDMVRFPRPVLEPMLLRLQDPINLRTAQAAATNYLQRWLGSRPGLGYLLNNGAARYERLRRAGVRPYSRTEFQNQSSAALKSVLTKAGVQVLERTLAN